jgi:TetR/AcrR family transcriptional regulator, repressor for uid operon
MSAAPGPGPNPHAGLWVQPMMKDPTPRAIRLGNGSQAGAPKQAVRGRGRPAGMVPAAATRARIVRAAREVYSRRGYHGTTMREVADRAGVSRPLVSVYFPGRPSVYRATIKATYLDVLLPAVGRAVQEKTLRRQLSVFLDDVAGRAGAPGPA